MILAAAIFASLLSPYPPDRIDPEAFGPEAPGFSHPFGTDGYGRDTFSRALHGARVSLLVGFSAVALYILIGTLVGLVSGFMGGITDHALMRIVDFVLCLPVLFLILILQTLFQPGLTNVVLVIGLTSWAPTARIVRAQVLSLKESLFVEAARALGGGSLRIMFRHLLPNTLGPVIVTATLGIGGAILTESLLSFLGLGVQPPHASWGSMLKDAREYLRDAPWLAFFPGALITATVLAFNLVGDGLRDLLDPKRSA
ncbi:MAG: ABC transporter permease [Armatimonadetes bacterium]|nr:ABC transporter permease [Armatimonadota bacterium]